MNMNTNIISMKRTKGIKFKATLMLLIIFSAMLNMISYSANAADIFFDSFESGDIRKTNTNGFSWATTSVNVSLVSPTHEVWSGANPINLSKANALDFAGGNWTAKSGQHSMRFRYPAGENWSEQRFDLGSAEKDVWISFWLRVPENFSYGPEGSPNKFFSLWSDGYSSKGNGSTVWLGFHRSNSADATIGFTYSDGGYSVSNAYQQHVPFITTTDKGRWMHMMLHYRTESSPGARDGLGETYRKWAGDAEYTRLHYAPNLPIKLSSGGPNGFKNGYILGWANAAYTRDTEWLLDDFRVSDKRPDSTSVTGNPPNAPTSFVVKPAR